MYSNSFPSGTEHHRKNNQKKKGNSVILFLFYFYFISFAKENKTYNVIKVKNGVGRDNWLRLALVVGYDLHFSHFTSRHFTSRVCHSDDEDNSRRFNHA